MQNSDEYLQHPGIVTTGRKKKKKQRNLATPTLQVLSFSKYSLNKLFWLLLPGNIPAYYSA